MLKSHVKFHSTNGKRLILVADDEMINRELLGAVLENEYEVLYAADGQEPIVLGLGTFIGAIINFLVIAFALFTVIKAMNKAKEMSEKLLKKKKEEEEAAAAAEPPKPTTEELLGEILAELKKQK